MKGFFFDTTKSRANPRTPGGARSGRGPRALTFREPVPYNVPAAPECGRCGLYRTCRSPKMPPTGEGRLGILFLAEAPGEQEDAEGLQLIGKSGHVLRARLKRLGLDLDRDAFKVNAINCRPPGNETPSPKQIEYCRPLVWKAIKELRPAVIVPLGTSAMESLLRHRWTAKMDGITKWRGWAIPDQDLQAWVVPTFHPSYILRGKENDVADLMFIQDLERAITLANVSLQAAEAWAPIFNDLRDYRKRVRLLQTEAQIVEALTTMMGRCREAEAPFCAFDYETTCIKPQAQGARILCASFCYNPWEAFAFVLPEGEGPVIDLWGEFLADKRIGKVASNMKFEDSWSLAEFGVEVEGWQFDTMLAAHVDDNRPGVTSLKFQAYVRLGVCGYDAAVEPYREPSKEDEKRLGDNAINRLHLVPTHHLLEYCALDSLFENLLSEEQTRILSAGGTPL